MQIPVPRPSPFGVSLEHPKVAALPGIVEQTSPRVRVGAETHSVAAGSKKRLPALRGGRGGRTRAHTRAHTLAARSLPIGETERAGPARPKTNNLRSRDSVAAPPRGLGLMNALVGGAAATSAT